MAVAAAVVAAAAGPVRSSCAKLNRQAMAGRLAARMDLIERAKAVEVALEGSEEEDDEIVSAVTAGFPDAAAAAAAGAAAAGTAAAPSAGAASAAAPPNNAKAEALFRRRLFLDLRRHNIVFATFFCINIAMRTATATLGRLYNNLSSSWAWMTAGCILKDVGHISNCQSKRETTVSWTQTQLPATDPNQPVATLR